MALTKRNKVMVALCVAGLAAVAFDQFRGKSPLGPMRAEASVDDTSAQPDSPALASNLQTARNATQTGKSMAERLGHVPGANRTDFDALRDAFTPSAAWVPQATASVCPEDSEKTKADAFLRKHSLQAVMVNGNSSQAVIDNKCLKVGQKLEDFELVSVSEQSAVMVSSGGTRVTFRLPLKPDGQ